MLKSKEFVALWLSIFTCCQLLGQDGSVSDLSVSVVDGVITFDGSIERLGGIEAKSPGGHLSLQATGDTTTTYFTTPFSLSDGIVVINEPDNVLIGVLGLDNHINISGTTTTAIQYAGDPSLAAGDLSIRVGAGVCGPLEMSLGNVYNGTCSSRGDWQFGETGGENGRGAFQLIDGQIYISGEFEDLSSIEITSPNGSLSLGKVDTGVKRVDPFTSGVVVKEVPDHVVYGVLGRENFITISGETKTALQYSESPQVAESDLSLWLGLPDAEILPVEVGASLEGLHATIVDGFVTLFGNVEFGGIEAKSAGGYLSLGDILLEGSTIFSALDNNIEANDPNRILVNSSNSVTLDGLTPTGIFFDGSAEAFAAAGIQVRVGLGDAAVPVALVNASVPEPSANAIGMLACVMLLGCRKRV